MRSATSRAVAVHIFAALFLALPLSSRATAHPAFPLSCDDVRFIELLHYGEYHRTSTDEGIQLFILVIALKKNVGEEFFARCQKEGQGGHTGTNHDATGMANEPAMQFFEQGNAKFIQYLDVQTESGIIVCDIPELCSCTTEGLLLFKKTQESAFADGRALCAEKFDETLIRSPLDRKKKQ